MTQSDEPSSPWHSGEKQLQARVGVADRMEQFGRKVIRDFMPEQHRDFYRQLPFLVLGSVDASGQPWASILEGHPGFAHAPDPRTLQINTGLAQDDPASSTLFPGASVGLLGIELHTRRRNRLSGQIKQQDATGIQVRVEHAFGNCPQYIQLRNYTSYQEASPAQTVAAEKRQGLDEAARNFIRASDTFFVASYITHDDGRMSVDVSHRGGQTGFVRVQGNRLSIPDFAGNLHFNTLGNLLLNPRAGLLFLDFASGDVLQLTGRTELTLEGDEIRAFQGAERLWHVEVEQCVWRRAALKGRWQFREFSPNSLMTGSWDQAQARLTADALRDQWRPLVVTRIEDESSTIRSFYLEPADAAGWPSYQAGQHLPIRLQLPGQAQPVIRTYSLSSAPSDNFLRISVKRAGQVSAFLHDHLQVGSHVEAKAARGSFILDPEERRPVVLLGAGVGVTPMMAMLREVDYQNRRLRRHRAVWLIQSARHAAELAYGAELRNLPQTANVQVIRVISQPSTEESAGRDFECSGRIDMGLIKSVLPFDDYDFYLCGPSQFTQDLYDGLRALNISDRRIHAESFGPSSFRRQPDAGVTNASTTAVATSPVPVLFERSAKEARWEPGQGSLLELAERRGLQPDFSCRTGSCGTCSTRILQGQVAYPQPILSEPEAGTALICCAQPAASDGKTLPLILDL